VFERIAPTPLSTVCFRAHPPGLDDNETLNTLNAELLDAVNETGEIFMSHTKLNGKYTLRLAIGNIRTDEKQVEWAWHLLQAGLAKMLDSDQESDPPRV
jgi:aromatic-L-amino-acid decarboxylase